jgi:hypothetical protein
MHARLQTRVRTGVAALLALGLAACSFTPPPLYAPLGALGNHGYAERQIGDNTFQILYRAPVFSTFSYGPATRQRLASQRTALAYDMALLRASDLALAHGMPAFRETHRNNDVRVDVQDDPFNDYWFNRPCFDFRCSPPPYVSRDRRTLVRAEVTLDVQFEQSLQAGAFDARATRNRILAARPNALPPKQLPAGGLTQ